MSKPAHLTRAYESAEIIPFDDSSKILLISDCHRGDGSWADDLRKNRNLYPTALSYYFREGFTCIELGDGDELWENRAFSEIVPAHAEELRILSRFYDEGRLYMLYGNHDRVKSGRFFVRDNLSSYYDERAKRQRPLFKGIKIHESLILQHCDTGARLFLVHGHQVDFLNDDLWRLARFLVRYLWKPLQLIGVHDPTSASKNHDKKEVVERRLMAWAQAHRQILIAGHTHRPVFPDVGEPPYFNDGCCVHPRAVYALEITGGRIALVCWEVKVRDNGTLYVARSVEKGPVALKRYRDALADT